MRYIITEKMCGFLLQTLICGQKISRRTRIIHELASRNISKRFIHSRKGVSVIHSVNKLNMVKMPNVSISSSICLCGRRYTSDMKNDEMVKAWMSEIKDDFEKEKKIKPDAKSKDEETGRVKDRLVSDLDVNNLDEIKKTTCEKDSTDLDENLNKNAITSEKAEEFVEPDVHGFTTEEMIELVKHARTSQTLSDSDDRTTADDNDDDQSDSSSSDSDDDDDDSSSSSSDSDTDDSKTRTKEGGNKASQSTEKQSKTEINIDSSGLAWDDSDITKAASNLRTELGKASRKNKSIGMIERKNKEVISVEENDRQDEYSRTLVRKNRDVRSIEERFKNASDFVKSEIEDFVNIDYGEPEEEVRTWEPPVPLTRGKTGVFDIEELVTVLESVRAREIAVIKIPDEIDYANYMVIVTALSYRHIRAITTDLKWIYKRKKNRKDNTIKVEGEDTKDWFAFDLGNIILHVFTAETRSKYDLETLWTVGPKFDPKCQEEVRAPVFTLSDLPWLEELEQGAAQETVTNQNLERTPKNKRKSPNQESYL